MIRNPQAAANIRMGQVIADAIRRLFPDGWHTIPTDQELLDALYFDIETMSFGRQGSSARPHPPKRTSTNLFSNYTDDGILRFEKSLNGLTEVDDGNGKIDWKWLQDEYALIYLTNTLTIDGIAGIYPSNTFITDYLPARMDNSHSYNKNLNPHFVIQNVQQEIDTSGWRTTLTGRLHYKWSGMYEK